MSCLYACLSLFATVQSCCLKGLCLSHHVEDRKQFIYKIISIKTVKIDKYLQLELEKTLTIIYTAENYLFVYPITIY